MRQFQANCLPVLIGSLPMDDHGKAIELVLRHTPEIPLWVQLPGHKQEGMMVQFLPGLPGLTIQKDRIFIDTSAENYDAAVLEFFEDYMAVIEGEKALSDSRFVLTADTAPGFFALAEKIPALAPGPVAVKGQITGPITLGIGTKDQHGRAVFYDEQVRDAIVKLVALKARWQVKQLSEFGRPVLIFFDEPALAGFGSSAYISISRDEVARCFEEVIDAVHVEGGLAGIHVCANADWSLILESSADIVSLDAYSFFDKFILYSDSIKQFFNSGRLLAWGIVPTLNVEDIEKETADSLAAQWEEKARQVEALGVDRAKILAQSLITPSCGTGSLSLESAAKVLGLTREVSDRIRSKI